MASTADPTTDPALHCFREDGCALHGPYPPNAPNLCCCCGQSPEDHSGCDCEDTCEVCGWSAPAGTLHRCKGSAR